MHILRIFLAITAAILAVSDNAAAYEDQPLPKGVYEGACVETKDIKDSNSGVPINVTPVRFSIKADHSFHVLSGESPFPPLKWRDGEWSSDPVEGVTLQLLWERVNGIIVIHLYVNSGEKVLGASKLFCKESAGDRE